MKQTNKAFLGLKGGGWKFCLQKRQQQHGCLCRLLPILGQPVGVQLQQERTNLYPFGLPSFFFDHSYTFSRRDSELGRLKFTLLAKSGVHRPKEKEEIN